MLTECAKICMDQPIIRLRPHHALCLRHYACKDCSNPFSENMAALHARLNSGNREMVQIILHRDSLCTVCPHQDNAVCEQEKKVLQMDKTIAGVCSIRSGQWLPWQELCAILDAQSFSEERCSELCARCPCHALCGKA